MSKKILLIQDDFDCTEVMRYILEEEGFEVVCPKSDEVLTNTASCDLVIVDEFCEGKTGCEICKQLKSDSQTCNKPVILTSAGMNIESLASACKADTYLVKPFDITYFTTLIKKMLLQFSLAL